MDRPVAFPEIKDFNALFIFVHEDEAIKPPPTTFKRADWRYFGKRKHSKAPQVEVQIGPYCSLHHPGRWTRVYVKANQAVEEYLAANWIGDSDGTYEVVVRDDGTALVLARYNQIIGSHWLALVDAKTVPAGV